MPTKKEIADTIILNKAGGQVADEKFDRRDMYVYIDMAFNDVLGKARADKRITSNASYVERIEDSDIQKYYDKNKNETFFVLPKLIVDGGLLDVRPPQGKSFFIQKPGSDTIYNELESGQTDNTTVYQVGERIYIKDSGEYDCCIDVLCIPAGVSYGEDVDMPIPAGYGSYFMERLLAFAEGNKANYQKKTIDSNPNTK